MLAMMIVVSGGDGSGRGGHSSGHGCGCCVGDGYVDGDDNLMMVMVVTVG